MLYTTYCIYVHTNIYTFTPTYTRLHEHFVELVGLSCSLGVRIPYGRKTGEARRLGRSPRSWTFVKDKHLHLNMSVYTNIYTFTLRYIRLHKHVYVYTNIYTFTLTYIRLHKNMYVYTNIYTFTLTYTRLH